MARHRLNEGEDKATLPTVVDGDDWGVDGWGVDEWGVAEGAAVVPRRMWFHRRSFVVAAGAVCALLALVLVGWSLSGSGATVGLSGPSAPWTPGDDATSSGSPSVLPSLTVSASPSPRTSPPPGPTPTPTPAATPAPVGLVLGSSRSLESIGLPGAFLAVNGTYGQLSPVTAASAAATKQAATFTVVAGLAQANCYTFRTASGSYLRHRDYQLRVDPFTDTTLFRDDATFCARTGSVAGSISFEAVNYPGRYLHRSGTAILLDNLVDTAAFRADCSFRVALAWA